MKVCCCPRINVIQCLARYEPQQSDNVTGAPSVSGQRLQRLELVVQVGNRLGNLQTVSGHVEDHLILGLREQQVLGVSAVGHLYSKY